MTMPDAFERVRAHYDRAGLVDRIKTTRGATAPEAQPLTVAQLAGGRNRTDTPWDPDFE